MIRHMTIRARIIAAFALILLSSVGLGLFANSRLATVNASVNDLGSNWLPTSSLLGDVAQHFETYRSRQAQVLILTGDLREGMFQKLAASHEDIQKDLKAYAPLVTKGEEEQLAKEMNAAINIYLDESKTFLERAQAGDIEGATAYLATDLQTALDNARKAIKAGRDFQVKAGGAAAASGIKHGKDATTLIIVALGLTALVAVLIGWVMIRSISAPIAHMAAIMKTLATGDTQVKVPNLGDRSEIGEMASAVEVFKDGLLRNQALEQAAVKAREDAEAQRKAGMLDLADRFETAVGGIVETVSAAATEMQATAQLMTSTAHESSAQAIAVSAAAEEAGTNVTSVAGSAEELGASVSEISRQVNLSLDKAREAVAETQTTAAIVHELNEAAGRITGIVELISGIASQTNLLALNATIESARAGEAGRGFAVVASEVKTLASQTSRATSDINEQIAAIQSITQKAVEAINGISETIRGINDSSATIAAAVSQQGSATGEIVQAVNQASVGTSEVTASITGVAQMAEETGQSAGQVLSASSELAQQAEYLRGEVNRFLSQIRAA